ncbi:MAG: M23 family metallopeptidase [Actinomycetota bacterium]|nr:M23 family metallopeptidase [Actinomycetota bacterium]
MRRWLPFVLALACVAVPPAAHGAGSRAAETLPQAAQEAQLSTTALRESVNEGGFRPTATAAASRRPAPVIISVFSLSSSTVRAGGAPLRVRFQVTGGASRVRVALYLTRVGAARASVVRGFGVERAGKLQRRSVRIGQGRVSAGRYVAALVAEDAVRGRRLRAAPAGFGSEVEVLAALTGGFSLRSKPAAPVQSPPPAPVQSEPAPAPVLNATPSAGTEAGVFPVRGAWSFGAEGARFGAARGTRLHRGQDVIAADGTPLAAPRAGVVSSKGYQQGGAGNYVVIRDLAGRDYVFMHMREASPLAVGAAVAAGAQIGRVGSTGASSGPHLHFEIWPQGWFSSPTSQPIDPLPALQAWAAS